MFIDAEVPQVKFVDRTYNAKVSHAMGIWNYIKEHDNGITNFHFEVAADLFSEEEFECLKDMRPGLVQFEIGVQSTNEETIREIHRVMDVKTVQEVTEKLKALGNMNLHLDLIAGLPYENYKRFQLSFDQLYQMRPHQLQLGFLKVLKGSYMYEHASEYGLIYHKRPPYEILKNHWLSFDDVIALKSVEEMVEIYYNSGQFSTIMALCFLIRKQKFNDELAYEFYQSLGEYYKKKGLSFIQHSRQKRYEILLSFLLEENKKLGIEIEEELLCEAILFDLYLRENVKNRPEFAPKLDAYCLKCKKQYKAQKHVEKFHYDFSKTEFYRMNELPEKGDVYIMFDYEKKNPVTGNYLAERIWKE